MTETFTVRVTDDRGAWDEKEITVTIKGTNDLPILADGSSEMNVVEAGVWGSKDPAHKPDEKVSSEEEYTQSVQFDKVDANDTHSLVIGGDLPKDAGLRFLALFLATLQMPLQALPIDNGNWKCWRIYRHSHHSRNQRRKPHNLGYANAGTGR